MSRLKSILIRIDQVLFGTRAAGLYLLLFAAAIGIATFIENDFGTSAAQKFIYRAKWFELLLVLFSGTLISNVIRYRMVAQKKWAQLIFHLSMILILIGAGLTRYLGYEGVMHIREGADSNFIYSSEPYLNFEASLAGQTFKFEEPILVSSLGKNSFEQEYLLGNKPVKVKLLSMTPNPKQEVEVVEDGVPILNVVFGSSEGRMEYYLAYGSKQAINGVNFNFSDELIPGAFNLFFQENTLYWSVDQAVSERVMATQAFSNFEPNTQNPLQFRALYNTGTGQFVFGGLIEKGRLTVISEKQKIDRSSLLGLELEVTLGNDSRIQTIYGSSGQPGRPAYFQYEDLVLAISYGAKEVKLPFSLFLRDFEMERYPGTNSPASYASEVTLVDNRNGTNQEYRIFMNNILDYDGYRFFQSSYDGDELGTYLSVNHDFWGTNVTYLGYALLTIGMVMVFFFGNTRFKNLSEKLRQLKGASMLVVGLFVATSSYGQVELLPQVPQVDPDHAAVFSEAIVQDFRGRMKPLNTLSQEMLRKVSGSESWNGMNSDQVLLSMYIQSRQWYSVPLIKLGKHERLNLLLGVAEGQKAAYRDFFEKDGTYKLKDLILQVNNQNPADRGVFEKEIIKVDERVNIMNLIFSGRFLRVFPVANDPNNSWLAPNSVNQNQSEASSFFNSYNQALEEGIKSGNYTQANGLLEGLKLAQRQVSPELIPSETQVSAELLLNKLQIFRSLALANTLLGLSFLGILFLSVFQPKWNLNKVLWALFGITILSFLYHTLGLGLRWYVSERAPWSNGYESMIYIAWTSTLAGLLFSRKSPGGMAATMILSGTVLLIAWLSYLDPEITPLVPVLKSYWLTIHVSLEAGSYGFLMLGAIMGLINLLLMLFSTPSSLSKSKRIIQELSLLSEMTLTGGLVMLAVGTYLGGVWANESWGRYWGWDAKETWALVSILVYAFILHMRLIPGLRGFYAYNVATLFGLSSVVMTYFGVNYYLSGLHSYAAGDPVPIPNWVYYAVISLIIISLGAFVKYKKYFQKRSDVKPIQVS